MVLPEAAIEGSRCSQEGVRGSAAPGLLHEPHELRADLVAFAQRGRPRDPHQGGDRLAVTGVVLGLEVRSEVIEAGQPDSSDSRDAGARGSDEDHVADVVGVHVLHHG